MLSRRTRHSAGLLAITLSMLATLAVAAPVAAQGPPGNNGTIKVDDAPFDDHPNNEPHVDCIFEVDFYGFDEGDLWADVIFEVHPPTGHATLVTDRIEIGEDDNSGGGSEAGHDASRQYDLSAALAGFPLHPQQGYHVKLTIHADGSEGADTKHKVFWVGPCATPNTPPPPPPPPSNPPSNGGSGVEGGSSGSQGSIPAPRSGTAASSGGPAVVAALPDTAMGGATSGALLIVGLILVIGSAVSLVAVRSEVRSRRR